MWDQWSEDMRFRYKQHSEHTHTDQSEHAQTEHTPVKSKLPTHNTHITPTRAHTDANNPLSLTPQSLIGTGTMGQIPDISSVRHSPDSVHNVGNSGSKIRTDSSTGAHSESLSSSPACTTTASSSSTSSSNSEGMAVDGNTHKGNEGMLSESENDTARTDSLDISIATSTPTTTPLRGTGRSSSDIGGWGEVHLVADHSDEDEGPVFITNPMGERRKKSTESTVSTDTGKFDDEKPFFMDNPLLSAPNSRGNSTSNTPPQQLEFDQINEMNPLKSEKTDKKNKKKGKKTAST